MRLMSETTNLLFDSGAQDVPVGITEAAAFLGVTPRTVDRWIRLEALPVHRLGSGPKAQKRFYLSELDQWIRSRYAADRAAHPTSGAGRRPADGLIG